MNYITYRYLFFYELQYFILFFFNFSSFFTLMLFCGHIYDTKRNLMFQTVVSGMFSIINELPATFSLFLHNTAV